VQVVASLETKLLQREYIELTNEAMPSIATNKRRPLRFNHCFQRIILETLFQDCWHNHLDRSSRIPTYKQLTKPRLLQAMDIVQQMISSPETIKEYNCNSLTYRNKLLNPTNY
jgi:hypothetical protein